jgi:hypothetical protein
LFTVPGTAARGPKPVHDLNRAFKSFARRHGHSVYRSESAVGNLR